MHPEIGSFGRLLFYPEKQVIQASYGNFGAYNRYCFQIKNDTLELMPTVFFENASRSPIRYYIWTLSPEEIATVPIEYDSFFDYENRGNLHEVSEEEYLEKEREILGDVMEWIGDDMYWRHDETIRKVCEEYGKR